MKKTALLTLVAMTLAGVCLTACGGGSEGGDKHFTLPEDDPSSTVEIHFWHCLGHDKTSNLQIIANSFNEKYAGKYHVSLDKVAGDYSSLASDIKTKLAAGEVPAISMGYPDSFSAYMSNSEEDSSIYCLDNIIADEQFGYTEEEIADFVPEYFAEGTNYQFDGVWSMPMYKSTEVVYYNENYFSGDNDQTKAKLKDNEEYNAQLAIVKAAAANVTKEQLATLRGITEAAGGYVYDLPETWEDMFVMGQKMKDDRKAQGITGEFYPVGYDSDANLLISQWAQRDIPYTQNSEECKSDPSKHYLFNNDEAKAFVADTVEKLKSGLLITKGYLGGSKYTNTYFTDVKTALSIGSTGGSSFQVSSNFRVGVAPVPHAAGKTAKYIQQGPSICFFDNDDPYIHKGAWLFYKEMAEPLNNAKLALENSYDPIRVSSYEKEEYRAWVSKHDRGLNYLIPYVTQTLKDNYMTSAVFVGSDTAREAVDEILADITNSGYTVDQAFNRAYNKCTN
ncbi:MAG: extracellular solute-binding protein [Candidatus Enteromonas sp.]|nr:extracellular solute-binding protein [Candidatus Enteromonas sp.]